MTRLLPLLILLSACGHHRINDPLLPSRAFDTAAMVYGLRPDLFPMDTVFVRCWTGADQRVIECEYTTEGAGLEFKRVTVRR